MREVRLTKSKGQMKNEKATTAPRLAVGIINNVMLVIAACLLARSGFAGAQPAPERLPGSDSPPAATSTNGAPAADTNSPVGSIAADLERLKARINTAVTAMSNAVASTPAVQAAKVTKLADEITELGTKDLARIFHNPTRNSTKKLCGSPDFTEPFTLAAVCCAGDRVLGV